MKMVKLQFVLGLILLVSNLLSIQALSNYTTMPNPPKYSGYSVTRLISHPEDPTSLYVILQPTKDIGLMYVVLVDPESLEVIADVQLPFNYYSSVLPCAFYQPSNSMFILIFGSDTNSTVVVLDSRTLNQTGCSFVTTAFLCVAPRGFWVGDDLYLAMWQNYGTNISVNSAFLNFDYYKCVLDMNPYSLPVKGSLYITDGFVDGELNIYLHGFINNHHNLYKGVITPGTYTIDVSVHVVSNGTAMFPITPIPPVNPKEFVYSSPYPVPGSIYFCSLETLQITESMPLNIPQPNQIAQGVIVTNQSYVAVTAYSKLGIGNGYLNQFSFDAKPEPGIVTVPQTAAGTYAAAGNYFFSFMFPDQTSNFITRWTIE